MSTQHLEVLETTLQKTHQWIDALAESAHMDPHTAYQALRAVLHTLRDRLPASEAAQLAAQLPLLVRGIYYEGYHPASLPVKYTREEFLREVSRNIVSNRITDPLEASQKVFELLERFLGFGELAKLGQVLPEDIKSLFPLSSAAIL